MSVEQIGVGQIEVQFDEKAVQYAFQAPIWVCTDTVLGVGSRVRLGNACMTDTVVM